VLPLSLVQASGANKEKQELMSVLPKTVLRTGVLFLLPVTLVILSISLSIAMNRRLETVNTQIRLMTGLSELERSTYALEQWLDKNQRDPAGRASESSWQALYENYQTVRAALSFGDSITADIELLLAQTDSLVRQVDSLHETIQTAISNRTATLAFERRFLESVQLANDNVKTAAKIVETQMTHPSLPLLSQWRILNIIVWVSCVFAAFLAVVYSRSITRQKRTEAARRESEEKYRQLVELSPEAITVHCDEKVVYVNAAGVRLFKADSAKDGIGKPIYGFIHPDYHGLIRERIRRLYQQRQQTDLIEVKMVRLDGTVIDVEVVAAPINYEGKPAAQVVIREITERKQAENALRESEERLRRFASAVTDVIYRYDPVNNRYDFISPSFELQTGYPLDEIKKDPGGFTDKIIHPDDAARVAQEVKTHTKKVSSNEPFATEYRVVREDGRVIWVSDRKDIEYTPDGAVYRINGVVRDITNRKLAETRLQESEGTLRRQNKVLVELAGRKALHSGDLQSALHETTQTDAETLEVERVCVWLYNESRSAIRCVDLYEKSKGLHSEGAELEAADYPAYFKALETERTIAADDAHSDPRTMEFSASYLAPLSISSMMDAPIRLGGQIVGVVCHEHVGLKRKWTHEEQNFAGSMADLVALALEASEHKRAERRLQLTQFFVDHSAEPAFWMDAGARFIYVNEAACRSLGYTRPELLTMTVRDIDPNVTTEGCCEHWEEVKRRGSFTFETAHRAKNGRIFPVEITVNYLPFEGKEYHCAFARDISERQQVRQTLEQMAAFPENNPDVVLTLNAQAEVLYMNPATVRLLKELNIAKDQIKRFLPKNTHQIISECLNSHKRSSEIKTSIADKTWTWTFHPLPSQNTVHCYATDITERIKSEQELKKLSAAVIQSANMILITDPNGVIEYVNPQFTRVTGYSLTEAVGKRVNILKSGRHDREFYKELWETITAGKIWSGHLQNRRKNGEHYWERKTITPIFDEKNQIINFLAIGDDITTEIITQQKLVEADKMSAVGMLAAGVAHEFKNYLTGIIGNASFALTELEQEGGVQLAQETLTKIVELGERANDVAMSLLTYSKAEPEDFNQEDIKKIITKSISLVEKEMKNLSIEIVTYFEEVPEVEVSASKIQQLLLNLLINAQHAIKSNGVITIALLRGADHIKIRVGDTGIGIPPKNLTKIFDPFFSTKGVWGKDELVGTGMGLSICRNIAREHSGDLSVESIVGVGTTFTLTLPVNRHEETALEAAFKKSQDYNVLIFTLDKSIVTHYFQQACEVKAQIILVDDVTKLPENFPQMADLVICDAKFTGKVELYRMVEACRNHKIPYIMVNCGIMEYQLADLYENSAANFKQLPDFSRILSTTAVSISRKATAQFA
jgi:PAS domain S-box-containing protein